MEVMCSENAEREGLIVRMKREKSYIRQDIANW